ncbi:3-isopropylmalate dehydrogenase 2 [Hibiscus syriacus]|uniref:3-isopropylmalate dehydrogenase 2 n=1 Tax=Hibiscus syriacus TaxID=106335 RepID=A0A6A3A857_HIBSY|nr:3-isopropylmalate dehydrogenase 2 [Hibiscus syriacus]
MNTEATPFSSGNPRIEETRGVMHLFSNDAVSTLPVERKPLACVLGVPNHMTYADFCQFCASFIHHISEMRIVRNDGMEDRYSVLIRFDSQDSTDKFYQHFNNRQFNSLEEEVCRVLFTLDVQFTGYTGSLDHVQSHPASSTEQPSCPVCLERLDQDASGILTTICIKGDMLFIHWKETQHCYSLELETQRVWDYAGDNYVHRLIQSKTDGKLVELNSHCLHANDGCGSCHCVDSGINEAMLSCEAEIVNEYNELLRTQLENQKVYFETLLQQDNEETERAIADAVNKVVMLKLQKIQAKLERCIKEKKFLEDLNENLLKNQEIWKTKLLEVEEREKKVLRLKNDRIQALEEQLRALMAQLEAAGKAVEQSSISNENLG